MGHPQSKSSYSPSRHHPSAHHMYNPYGPYGGHGPMVYEYGNPRGGYYTKDGTHLMGAPDHPFYRNAYAEGEGSAQYHTPSSSSIDARYYHPGSFGSSTSYHRGARSEASTPSSKPTPRRSNESLTLGKQKRRDDTTSGSDPATYVSSLPRPQAVKRDTSHQNETAETKTQVKRLNRQSSIGHRSNNSSLGEVSEHDMACLENSLEQSSLAETTNDDSPVKVEVSESKVNATITINKPPLMTNRVSTLDLFEEGDIFPNIDPSTTADPKPTSIGEGDRQATFGSIDLASIMGGELDISTSSSAQPNESAAETEVKKQGDVQTLAV